MPATRLRPLDRPRDVLIQLAGFVAFSHLLYSVVGQLPGYAESRIAGQLAEAAGWADGARPARLVAGALMAPLLEELLFRGLVFEGLRRWRGPGVAIAGSALLFGLAHPDAHQAVLAGLLGLQLGALRQVHGLGLAIAAHATNNGFALAAAALSAPPAIPDGVRLGLALVLTGIAWASLAQSLRSTARPPAGPASDLQTAHEPSE